MVDRRSIQPARARYIIEEQALVAKTGRSEENEDSIHISPHFVAVIDGVTAKTNRRWNGRTGGQVCAQIIDRVLCELPENISARNAIDALTAAIKDFYTSQHVLELVQEDPSQRITACLIVISFGRREIWCVGDCQCLLDDRLLLNTKRVDTITAEARAMFLETEVHRGVTLEALRQHDTGRELILPLLKQQQVFQNNPAAGSYWYAVVDGFPVPDGGIQIEPIPETTRTIILASDGYPVLKNTLATSEEELRSILAHDPLLFRIYKATKGLQVGYVSYDDRAYMKLKLLPEPVSEGSVVVQTGSPSQTETARDVGMPPGC